MARQRGIIKLDGTIADITFLKTQDGYMAKEKSHISADKIANDPVFQRTRENNAEFGRAGKAGKVLRTAFRNHLQTAKDSRMISRLTTEMMRVVKADTVSARGFRNVIDGELAFIEGFDFNVNGKLGTTLFAPYTTAIDRATGSASVSVDPYVPVNQIAAPSGTTHFRIRSAAAEVDFSTGGFVADEQSTAVLPWDNTATAALTLSNSLTANSTHPIFLILGIEFLQHVNGTEYPLKNGAFNALSVVKVDVV